MLSAWRRFGHGPGTPLLARPMGASLALILGVGLCCGAFGYLVQATQNRLDANERFAEVAQRVERRIVERMHRYEYGLRGARGVAVAADGTLTRGGFARYAASRQIDKEFPGARGFGIVLRVPQAQAQDFLKRRQQLDAPDFTIRALGPNPGDRLVITFVEPAERNREALGLDIGSESARRTAAWLSARSGEATLTAPLTLVQASGHRSGGLLLLLPIRRPGPTDGRWDDPGEELVGWSYAPLLIEDVLKGSDDEEAQYHLALFDLDHDVVHPFFSAGEAVPEDPAVARRAVIPLYGRRWEAVLTPTPLFFAKLHLASPAGHGLLGLLLGAAVTALIATLAQLADRTRSQRLEQARRAAIVEGSADAIVVQTLDGRITDWNEGAERLFGYTKDESTGRTATELLIPDGLESEDAMLRETVADGGRVTVFETIRRARDGSAIPVSITASPIRNDAGVVVGSAKILRDVREAKAAEHRMRELNASLEDQVRERTARLDQAMREARDANEAKSRFLANISHEIRTPMNAVIGMTHLLARTPLDKDQSRMLARVDTAGKALLALLNDVLDLSKIEARQMTLESTPFRLEQVIDQIASIASVSAEQRGIAFRKQVDVDPGLVVVGDPTRFGQIVLNLLTNAVKFTMAGEVSLSVRVGAIDATRHLPIVVTVSDTGIGIPADLQERLFSPFVQADSSTTRRFGGTGLGLSIVRQLSELMGGAIRLRSQPGQGSEFELTLALRAAETAAMEAFSIHPLSEAPNTPLAGLRILVVDDNELNRDVAARLLRAEGAHVTLAENGSEAVERLGDGERPFDAVLMDVQMPVMDGLDATRRIRASSASSAKLPIIGLTAGVSDAERTSALSAGMNAVVGKPFDPEGLTRVITRHIAHRGPGAAPTAPTTSQGEVADWPELPGLVREVAFHRLGGDTGLLRRMVTSLGRALASTATLLSRPVEQAPWGAHARTLHDFKSVAGTLGGEALYRAAADAERLLRDERWEDARRALTTLDALGAPLRSAIDQRWPDDRRDPAGASTSDPRMPSATAGDDPGRREDDRGDLAVLLARLAS